MYITEIVESGVKHHNWEETLIFIRILSENRKNEIENPVFILYLII
jgi:hypothetical protein